MLEEFLVFMIFLFILAAAVQQDYLFTILYLFTGAFIFGTLWSRKSLAAVSYKRTFLPRVFLNEEVKVKLEVKNTGWLPVIWLRIHDSLPVDLTIQKYLRYVFTLNSHGKKEFEYVLQARKRGYYQIGPLFAFSGDLLGLAEDQTGQVPADYLTVFPRIVPLTSLKITSQSPMGSLRHTQPIFEDPNRVLSKRDYVAGDSLRRIDWKATAATGRLQVKQFEPSIALETSIFLNLNAQEYEFKNRIDSTELAIVIAASIANWVSERKQSLGLVTNGLDPFLTSEDKARGEILPHKPIQPIPPRKGRAHLIRILDILARVQAEESASLLEILRREYVNLAWGTTIIIISELIDTETFNQLFTIRRAGLNIMLILTGQGARFYEIKNQAQYFNIPLYQICSERDLDIWRR